MVGHDIDYDSLTTVQEVVEYYHCQYISEKGSVAEGYDIDISLIFTTPLYEGDISNEKFYQAMILDVARVLRFKDFRMIDQENAITIEVLCENGKINKIIINGIEDYFIYMDSQIELKTYAEIPITDFTIQSPQMLELIDSNWSTHVNFGTRESIFNNYYIYFDEGMEVRTIQNQIYNIIFTSKYNETVVNAISPNTDLRTIQAKLGNPTFIDEENHIVGYKGKEFYIFFNGEEISIYRMDHTNTEDFFKLIDQFLTDEIDLLDFMNALTYLWPDYEQYKYTANSVFLSYPQKGVEIKINYDDTEGIIIYNNINDDLSKIEKYLQNTEFIARLKLDGIFEAEKRRVQEANNLLNLCNAYTSESSEEDSLMTNDKNTAEKTKSAIYSIYPEIDENQNIVKMNFVANHKNEEPNRELYDNISTYLWINDTYFLFSKNRKGIYLFDLETGKVKTIISGNENYQLKNFKDGILTYDDKEYELPF